MDEETRRKALAIARIIATTYLDHLQWINDNLKKYNLTLQDFITMSKAEKFTRSEIHDHDYMLEKFEIWQHMFEETCVDYMNLQKLIDEQEVVKISNFIIKHKLSIQDVQFNCSGFEDDAIVFDVVDDMLGQLYKEV